MKRLVAIRTLGILMMLFSITLAPPVIVSLLYEDGESIHLIASLSISLAIGALFWLPGRRSRLQFRNRDGFLIVGMFWITISLLGSVPFVLGLDMTLADAVFESASGFTTTGATVIVGLDDLPPSILFFRQELQWLGGIGVIVSAIALLPFLGVGGMQLMRAETSGPLKDEKLMPRVANTAQIIWKLYLGLTVACALFYWLAGMNLFDAVAHSLSTLSTGGYSTHDASIAYFDSPAIEAIAIVFMLLGGINFGVHFVVWKAFNPIVYWRNTEVRVFLSFVLLVIILVAWTLYVTGMHDTVPTAVRYAAFEVVSVITSTGFGIENFATWPLQLPALLIFISFVGGCAGSTAGGMKVIRFVLLGKLMLLQLRQLVHPRMMRPLMLGGYSVDERVMQSVGGYFALYVITFVMLLLVLMASGLDQVTAFGAVATTLNNLGPGLGDVAQDFTSVGDFATWVLALAMILGRLEIFTIMVLLAPGFWRA